MAGTIFSAMKTAMAPARSPYCHQQDEARLVARRGSLILRSRVFAASRRMRMLRGFMVRDARKGALLTMRI
jgi:hypothetical protein